MKKTVRIAAALTVVFLAAMLCGCSVFNVFSVDSLIKAPRLTGENAEIQKAFEDAVGTEISLVRPVSGEYRSAYVLHDYDGDGSPEAIVFYTPSSTSGEVRMHILKYYGEEKKWKTVADVKGNGSDVHSITFCNFDRDSVAEIVVAWAFADGQKDKMLTVYRYGVNDITGQNDFVSLASVRISDFSLLDIDFDGADELLYTIIDAASEKPAAVIKSLKFDIATSRFVPISEVTLDNRIVSFISYSHDLKAGNHRFYIDVQLSDGRYMTEILYYDYARSAFVRPMNEEGVPLGVTTIRQKEVLSEDINGDGIIDIPRAELYEKSEVITKNDGDNRVFAVEYYNLDGDKLISIGSFYTFKELNFRIRLDKYKEYAFIRFDKASGIIMFYSYPEEGKNNSKLLFTVKSLKNGETSRGHFTADKTVPVEISVTQEGQNFGITPESVRADIITVKRENV